MTVKRDRYIVFIVLRVNPRHYNLYVLINDTTTRRMFLNAWLLYSSWAFLLNGNMRLEPTMLGGEAQLAPFPNQINTAIAR